MKINKIIQNLETIKSRDGAIHKENCNCELCESIKIANTQKNLMMKLMILLLGD